MRISWCLAAVGLIAGLIALFGYLNTPRDVGDPVAIEATLRTSPPSSTATAPPASTTTSTGPLWAANDSSVLADLAGESRSRPEWLIIPALGIDAPVGAYGVDAGGEMEVPDNVNEAGWYEFGPLPGEAGSAVVAAHVDLAGHGRGLFYDLGLLEPGDQVLVRFSDSSEAAFQVVARSTYLKSELPLDAIFSRSGDPVLTLITCGGGFSRSTGRYDSNVVVYAVPFETARSAPPESIWGVRLH